MEDKKDDDIRKCLAKDGTSIFVVSMEKDEETDQHGRCYSSMDCCSETVDPPRMAPSLSASRKRINRMFFAQP